MISTTTSVTSFGGSSYYGNNATFTAIVTPASGGPVTGTVVFFADSVKIGAATLTWMPPGQAMAQVTIATLLGGSHTITATYLGDGNFSPSSGTNTYTVNPIVAGFNISSSSQPSVFGQTVTFTATWNGSLTAGTVPPSGNVQFQDGMTPLGTVPLTPTSTFNQMQARLSTSTLSVGNHQIRTIYNGDTNYSASPYPFTQTVTTASSSVLVTSSPNPSVACQSVTFTATVSAVSPGSGTPTGSVTFTINGTQGSPIALSGGKATYSTSFRSAGSNTVSADYSGDSNYSSSSSPTPLTQTVNPAVNFISITNPPGSDPLQGKEYWSGSTSVDLADGSMVHYGAVADASVSSKCECSCDCKDDNSTQQTIQFSYNSRTVNVQPIFQTVLTSDFCASVPSSIKAQLTWAGTAQPTVTFDATGHSPGDVYNLPLQVSSPVSSTGNYNWSVRVVTTVGTFVYDTTISDTLAVLVNTASPFGAGWSLAGTETVLPGSLARFWNGTGKVRKYGGTPGTLPFTYTNPANDQGTMVKNADGSYTYTDKYQVKTNYNSSGQIIGRVDPHGLTTTYGYSSGLLSTIMQPDGGVATLGYVSNYLKSVQEPGGRYLTMSYDGSNNLIGMIDAAGGLYTFAYDGNHRLINEKVAPLNTTYNYSPTNGTMVSIDRGLGSITTITAAAVQGLGASTAINLGQAVGTVKDPLGNVTSYTLDSLGRLTQLQTADGALQTWTLDAAGNPTVYIDQLGRVSTSTYNASEDLTQIQYPDGTFTTFQYDSTFHLVKQIQDALNHLTTMTYDGTTSDPLTVKDALGNVTTFTWSNGLKQTTTDALGRVTTLNWDSAKHRCRMRWAISRPTGMTRRATGYPCRTPWGDTRPSRTTAIAGS